MKLLQRIYIGSVLLEPAIFFIYYSLGMVCAPRAYVFAIITGVLSCTLYLLAVRLRAWYIFLAAAAVPAYIVLIAPVTMVTKLGADKWLHERMTAYHTFEFFALAQLLIITVTATLAYRSTGNRTVPAV